MPKNISADDLPANALRRLTEEEGSDLDQLCFHSLDGEFFLENHDELVAFEWNDVEWIEIDFYDLRARLARA